MASSQHERSNNYSKRKDYLYINIWFIYISYDILYKCIILYMFESHSGKKIRLKATIHICSSFPRARWSLGLVFTTRLSTIGKWIFVLCQIRLVFFLIDGPAYFCFTPLSHPPHFRRIFLPEAQKTSKKNFTTKNKLNVENKIWFCRRGVSLKLGEKQV